MAWTDPVITGTFGPTGRAGGTTPDPLPVVTVPDADAYFLTTPRNAEWLAIGPNHQIWLNESQRYLGQLCFDQNADCCGKTFADAWTGAVSELALALSKNPSAVIGGGVSTSGAVKRNKLGDLEQEFFDPGNAATKVSSSAPLILQAFPWLTDWLGCWLQTPTGSSRILSRCC
mgnify:FL=1